jgi:hypothetical protein
MRRAPIPIKDETLKPMRLVGVQIHSYGSLVDGGSSPPPKYSVTPARAGAHRGNGSRPSAGKTTEGDAALDHVNASEH